MKGFKRGIFIISLSSLLLSACGHKPSGAVSDSAVAAKDSEINQSGEAERYRTVENSAEIRLSSREQERGGEEQAEAHRINVQFPYSETEGIAKTEAPTEKGREETMFQAVAGSWKLDGARTQTALRQHSSLQEMFGTGLGMGSGLEISTTGEMSYYIGIGIGGTGQCQISGDAVTVSVTPYEAHGGDETDFTFRSVTEGNKTYLIMNSLWDEEIYWSK